MVKQNNIIYHQLIELNRFKLQDPIVFKASEKALNAELNKRWIMIAGEGSVFLLLMILGIVKIQKTFKAEAAFARQQNNFILSVTHELKSPLASAKLQMQTLLKRELDRDKQKEIISNAIVDIERLNHLVENILLAAKIDNAPNYTIHKESTPLDVYIKDILSGFSSSVKQNIELHLEPGIYLDLDRISFPSIVLNLFENAIKYSPLHSTIKVMLEEKDKKTCLSFIDEGKGITDGEKQNVFKKFYRTGNEETRKTKGTGLGLYVVKHLVEQHGGQIKIKDNFPKGSIFEVVF